MNTYVISHGGIVDRIRACAGTLGQEKMSRLKKLRGNAKKQAKQAYAKSPDSYICKISTLAQILKLPVSVTRMYLARSKTSVVRIDRGVLIPKTSVPTIALTISKGMLARPNQHGFLRTLRALEVCYTTYQWTLHEGLKVRASELNELSSQSVEYKSLLQRKLLS